MSTPVDYQQDAYLWALQQMDALRQRPSPHLDNVNLINMMMKNIVVDKMAIRRLWRRLLVIWISEHSNAQPCVGQPRRKQYLQYRLQTFLTTSPFLHHYYHQILDSMYQDALDKIAETKPDIYDMMPEHISVSVDTLLTYP